MCSKRTLTLPEVQEDDEDAVSNSDHSQQSQFQVSMHYNKIYLSKK